ncbi:MAG: hypothetical protein ALECFALPRED_006140 [Alectoria fallacina]|uniref:Glutathione S-transferase n=1 Tax=Alectoria fallacina TaxID=1903189 RepID=A0A8H3IDW6_9LECA|nr:MAG: hypothetical protein ALECFALPRED_006140 [Alectoria fallacina]
MGLKMPDLTLYFLQASRSIRIAWLLEELGLDYKLEAYDREDTGLAPAGFKQSCGTALGKAPVLKDGKLTLQESGAITEYVFPFPSCISAIPNVLRLHPSREPHPLTVPARYLCEHYDKSHRLLPTEQAQRVKVREWIHAAEGAFMVHCLPMVYVRRIDASAAERLAPGLAGNVARDLDWLEAELKRGNGRYLVGDHVTAADTMVAFSIQFIFWLKLAQDRKWEGIEAWLRNVEAGETYQRAVAKTGHHL